MTNLFQLFLPVVAPKMSQARVYYNTETGFEVCDMLHMAMARTLILRYVYVQPEQYLYTNLIRLSSIWLYRESQSVHG
jgi:hypothetical protein